MADDATDPKEGGDGAGKGKMKLIIMIAGLLLGEAAVMVAAFSFLAKEPAVSTAGVPEMDPEQAALEKIVEINILDDRLENAKAGVTFVYPTEIYAHVKQRHQAMLNDELALSADLEAEVRAIWRTSPPSHFQEPKLDSLRRKVAALLQERLGNDPETGESIIVKVIIVMGTGYRADA